jgi:hypothetical protein
MPWYVAFRPQGLDIMASDHLRSDVHANDLHGVPLLEA